MPAIVLDGPGSFQVAGVDFAVLRVLRAVPGRRGWPT
jgi:hypothetical protein